MIAAYADNTLPEDGESFFARSCRQQGAAAATDAFYIFHKPSCGSRAALLVVIGQDTASDDEKLVERQIGRKRKESVRV